jgi:hypothetical protein
MIGRHQGHPIARHRDLQHFDLAFVIDVIEVEDREKPRVGPLAAQVLGEVDALQPLRKDVFRDSARPLVEIAEDDLRPRYAPIVNERGELGGLVAPLEQ